MADKDIAQLINKIKNESPDAAKALEESFNKMTKSIEKADAVTGRFATNLQKASESKSAMDTALNKTYEGYREVIDETQVATEARLGTLNEILQVLNVNKSQNKTLIADTEKLKVLEDKKLKSAKELTKEQKTLTAEQSKQLKIAKNITAETDKTASATKKNYSGIAGKAKFLWDSLKRGATSTYKDIDSLTGGTISKIVDGTKTAADNASDLAVFTAMQTSEMKKLFDFKAEAKKAYNEVSNLTTGFATLTGQIFNTDSAVRKGGKSMAGFAEKVMELQKRNRLLGATIKDITEAYGKLMTSSKTFGMLMSNNSRANKGAADVLTEVGFRLSKAGLSTETFGAAIDVLGKTYRRGDIIGQSKKLGMMFVNISRATGLTTEKVGKDYVAAMQHLSAYTLPEANAIFKKLSATVAETGVEMSELLKISTGFDDMEKAAGAVGDLNAMMGGPYLNTLDMVNASEEERIAMLRNMISESGESFNTMDRFKKKAIAEAIGTDVKNAAGLLSGSQSAIESMTSSVDKQGASYNQLSQAAAKNATSMDQQMNATKQSMVLMKGSFAKVDSMGRKMVRTMSEYGEAVKEKFGGAIINTLDNVNLKFAKMVKLMKDGSLSAMTDLAAMMTAVSAAGGMENLAVADAGINIMKGKGYEGFEKPTTLEEGVKGRSFAASPRKAAAAPGGADAGGGGLSDFFSSLVEKISGAQNKPSAPTVVKNEIIVKMDSETIAQKTHEKVMKRQALNPANR